MIKRLIAVAALAAVLTGCGQENGNGLPDVFPMDSLRKIESVDKKALSFFWGL